MSYIFHIKEMSTKRFKQCLFDANFARSHLAIKKISLNEGLIFNLSFRSRCAHLDCRLKLRVLSCCDELKFSLWAAIKCNWSLRVFVIVISILLFGICSMFLSCTTFNLITFDIKIFDPFSRDIWEQRCISFFVVFEFQLQATSFFKKSWDRKGTKDNIPVQCCEISNLV